MSKKIKTKFGNARVDEKGYYRICSYNEGNYGKYLHRLIYEDFYKVTIINSNHIHHINGNKKDNDINNLELISPNMHSKNHSKGENNPFYNKKHTFESRIKRSESTNTTGYYRVSKSHDNKYKQGFIWVYAGDDENNKYVSISSIDIDQLKEKVLARGLPWYITDEDKANATKRLSDVNKEINKPHNSSGYYRVSKMKTENYKQGFKWVYHYPINGKMKSLASAEINQLKDKVLAKGLPWYIIDEDTAKITQELSDKNKKTAYSRNTSGYYRVSKDKDKSCKQGFRWTYAYRVDGKRKCIKSVDINKLKEKVLARGLEWFEY